MQRLALEMLVDHYPLRNAVLEGCGENLELHSMKLLAEAMSGSELLLLVTSDSTDKHLKPLVIRMEGKAFLIAGTTLEYADNPFIQYLNENIVSETMKMQEIDARELVIIAVGLGNVDGILFDMNIDETNEDAFEKALLDSTLTINENTVQAVVNVDALMGGDAGNGGYRNLPSHVLSLLAREEDPDERRKALSGYLSHRSRYELGRTVFFVSKDEADDDSAYTTLARGIYNRMIASKDSEKGCKEHNFIPVTALEWLGALADAGAKRVTLDGNTVISGRFARSVLGIETNDAS